MADTVKKQKTTIEWLMMLKEPYRSQAIGNNSEAYLSTRADSISNAITHGFSWLGSPEGLEYWGLVYDNIEEYLASPQTKKEDAPQPVSEDINLTLGGHGTAAPSQSWEPIKEIPRRVMVKEHPDDEWREAELLADLTQFGIEKKDWPYIARVPKHGVGFLLCFDMMEMDEFTKKPMSLRAFAATEYIPFGSPYSEKLDDLFEDYQAYLKEFKNKAQ